jgi:hypothetical protein
MVEHYLKAKNLKQMLISAGVVQSKTLHGARNREVYHEHVLNLQKCCQDAWHDVEAQAIAYGVINFAEKNDDGHYGRRRDLTEQEIEELKYWPIVFNNDDEIVWMSKWVENNDPAIFIAKLFPNTDFTYSVCDEGQLFVANAQDLYPKNQSFDESHYANDSEQSLPF